MKRKIISLLLLPCCFTISLTGCNSTADTTPPCAKCGNPSTTSISCSAQMMEQYGISISKCQKITDIVYSAPICDNCVGDRVVTSPFM